MDKLYYIYYLLFITFILLLPTIINNKTKQKYSENKNLILNSFIIIILDYFNFTNKINFLNIILSISKSY
jgi:hypothetical protein